MRLLEISGDGSGAGAVLRLHPRLAVVQAESNQREHLVAVLERALAGIDEPAHGLIEVHGILMDLSGQTTRMLGLDGVVHPVVRPADLPGVPGIDASRTRRRIERHHEQARRRLAQARQAVVEALDQCRSVEAGVTEAVSRARSAAAAGEAAEARIGAARVELADATTKLEDRERDWVATTAQQRLFETRASDLSSRIDELRVALTAAYNVHARCVPSLADSHARLEAASNVLTERTGALADLGFTDVAAADVERAHRNVDAARRRVDALERDLAALVGPSTDQLPELVARREELVVERAELDLADQTDVEVAMADLAAQVNRQQSVDEVAATLADEYRAAVERQRVITRAFRVSMGSQADDAHERMERARIELAAAQRDCRRPVFDLGVRARIEQLHEEVLAADQRAERRLSGTAARNRLRELKEQEAKFLADHGLASFSDYLLSASTARTDTAGELRLASAAGELEAAERALGALTGDVGDDDELRAVEAQLRFIRSQAIDLLGHDPGDRIEEVLRAQTTGRAAELQRLCRALAAVGVAAAGPGAVEVARQWLAQRAVDEQRDVELGVVLQSIEFTIAELNSGESTHVRASDGLRAELEAARGQLDHAAEAHAAALAVLGQARRAEQDHEEVAEQVAAQHATIATLLSEKESAQRALLEAEGVVEACRDNLEAAETALRETEPERGELAERAAEAARAIVQLRTERDERAAEFSRLEQLVATAGSRSDDTLQVDEELAADRALDAARAELVEAEHDVDQLSGQLDAAKAEEAALTGASSSHSDVADIEFYVLGRLAAHRAVGCVGSVPLVFDDSFAGLPDEDVAALLAQLDRLSEAVQILYLADDSFVLRWAAAMPADRVAVTLAPSLAEGR